MIVRPATINDLKSIFRVSRKVHLSASYTNLIPAEHRPEYEVKFAITDAAEAAYIDFMEKRIADDAWQVIVAEIDGNIVGYAQSQRLSPTAVRLKGLFVDYDFQGQGIGGALFSEQMRFAHSNDTVEFEVIANNQTAIGLYRKHGFIDDGYGDSDYYGAKMLRMKKTLLFD